MAKKPKSGERNWSEAEARRVLAAWEDSGLSMRAYAMRERLCPRRLYWWTKRLAAGERGRRGDEQAVRFVPGIVKVAVPRLKLGPAITVRVGASATMEIVDPKAVPAGWIAEVMTELERIACS